MNQLRMSLAGLLLAVSANAVGAAAPVQMAANARFDLVADESVGALRDGRLVQGNGEAQRCNWLPAETQPRSLTVDVAIWPFGWRSFELRFTPVGSGVVELCLMGPWQEIDGQIVQQEVFWDQLTAEGARLENGSFETSAGGKPAGWELSGGTIETATAEIPAADGRHFAKSWHNARLVAHLQVTAGQAVRLRGRARAVIPANFPLPRRITTRDTPAHRAARHFLRGVNLGNYLEAPPGDDWGARYTTADLDQIRQEGFDHVRLPVAWHHHAGPAPAYLLSNEIYAKVDFLVSESVRRRLHVMVNLHHFDEFTSHPRQQRGKFLAIWRQLASHYASRGDEVAFELLNEPKDAATTEVLNELYADAIREIRVNNPDRTIFVGPGRWNATDELPKLRLPDDDLNLIATVHCYLPFYFTHQGASWVGPDVVVTGIRFPGPPDQPLRIPPRLKVSPQVVEWIDRYNSLPAAENPSGISGFSDYLHQAREWSEYFGRPVHVGEFGCIDRADSTSRANYLRAVRRQLEADGIGWALWDWKARFRYWNSLDKRPLPGLHEALFSDD